MNEFLALFSRQLAADARSLPTTARSWLSTDRRVQRCGTIGELRHAAQRAVPRVMFDFVDGAANDEVTAEHNQADFADLEIMPRMLVDVSNPNVATTVLGQDIALPLLGAPMGLNSLVHHHGEVGIARALHDAGLIPVLATMASYSIRDLADQSPGPTWFQIFLFKDRGLTEGLVELARGAGALALVVTVDVQRAPGRDRDRRNRFGVPPRVTLRSLGDSLIRPGWSAQFIRHPRFGPANIEALGGPVGMAAFARAGLNPSAGWDDLAWLREIWAGPLVVKGILSPDDARRAVELGADAISVSNHGGRQLDHAPSTIRALPGVVDAVDPRVEVYLDGGVRRGSDILKALAIGARACMVGRPLMYGLAAGGETGARKAVAILDEELRTAMALAGCPSVSELDRSWVRSRVG